MLQRMVPEAGIEPARSCLRQILSLVRLPISPLGHLKKCYYIKKYFKNYLKCRKKDAKFEASQKNYFFFAFLEAATASLSCLPTLNLTTFVAGDL